MFSVKRVIANGLRLVTLAGIGSAFLWCDVPVAHAQLETVTVTARKRQETVQDLPNLVAVVTQQKINDFSLKTLEDVARLSPDVNISRTSSGTGARISMRGIDNSPTSLNIAMDVAVIVDGVYYPNGRVVQESMIDVGQIEVLKGPQTVFQGKNAISGALNIRTNDPGPDFEAFGTVGYETRTQNLYTQAVISVPVSDKLGIRVAGAWSDMFDGYMKNQAVATTASFRDSATGNSFTLPVPAPTTGAWPGEKDTLARMTIKYTPNDNFVLRLKGQYADYYATSPGGVTEIFKCTNGVPQNDPAGGAGECAGNWATAGNPFPAEAAATNPIMNKRGGELYEDYHSYYLTADAAYTTTDFSWTTTLNFQHTYEDWLGDNDGPSRAFKTGAGEISTFRAFSGESRFLTSWDGWFNFMVGGYFQTTHQIFDQFVETGGAYNSLAAPENQYTAYTKHGTAEDTTYSGYAQVILRPLTGVELTAGGRYIHEEITANFEQPYVNPNFQGLWIQGDPINRDLSYNSIKPEFTLDWKVTPDWSLYARYATGFKQGGFSLSGIRAVASNLGGDEFVFKPETVKGYEGGVKASLLVGAMRFQLGGYNYTFHNFQIDYFNSASFAQVTTNAGSVKTTGAEFQVDYAPPQVKGLTLGASVSYNDARYGEFIAPCYAGQTPDEGCTIFTPGYLPRQDLAGAKTALSPYWTMGANASYDWSLGNGFTMGVTANMMYKSKYQLSIAARPDAVQHGYATLDMSLRVMTADEHWKFQVIGRNLTNQYALYYSTDASGSGSGTGTPNGVLADLAGTPIMPRTIAVELSYRY